MTTNNQSRTRRPTHRRLIWTGIGLFACITGLSRSSGIIERIATALPHRVTPAANHNPADQSAKAGANGSSGNAPDLKAQTFIDDETNGGPERLDDWRLAPLRKAAESWRKSFGSRRRIVDQVCLVNDYPDFLEAITLWDEQYFFPILIDQPALTLPFLRAFRPARVMRYSRQRSEPASDVTHVPANHNAIWRDVTRAVARACSGPEQPDQDLSAFGVLPRRLGTGPPGVVLTSPASPMLAGAVALAAGRFQPIIWLEPQNWPVASRDGSVAARRFGDLLTLAEGWQFAYGVQSRVASLFARLDRLGDDCDFITLAGDWPYRYLNESGDELTRGIGALDDLIGRNLQGVSASGWLNQSRRRWAYTGRLLGDPAASLARAMGALFLQPASVLCWDTYPGGTPWSQYSMPEAVEQLGQVFPGQQAVQFKEGNRADLNLWHQVLDPLNRFDLFLINSSGGPHHFAISSGPGRAADLPIGIPVAVSMIHSFSAANPTDPQTIAGRWLEQGAFAYFGSLHEPYLHAFRRPRLVADLVTAGIPFVAALRQGEFEQFGHPWRLVYLGDPLYRIERENFRDDRGQEQTPGRISSDEWRNLDAAYRDWPAAEIRPTSLSQGPVPAGASLVAETSRLSWCVDAAIGQFIANRTRDTSSQAESRARKMAPVDWRSILRQIRRDHLDPGLRPILDDLLIDTLKASGDLMELSARLSKIPINESRLHVWLALESCATARLARLVREQDSAQLFGWVLDLWDEVIRLRWPAGALFPAQFTERVAALAAADPTHRLSPWRERVTLAATLLSAQPGQFRHVDVVLAEKTRLNGGTGTSDPTAANK